MPRDWIKMRTDLYRDPKVIKMAKILSSESSPTSQDMTVSNRCDMSVTSNVMRNVMRNATVGCLVTVWGVARQEGRIDGDDLVLEGITIDVLDEIAELAGFGQALTAVGWAVESHEGLRMPRFFEENNEPPPRKAKSNAERQREYRERQKSKKQTGKTAPKKTVTKSNESNDRGEERRGEESVTHTGGAMEPPSAEEVQEYIDHRHRLNPAWPVREISGEWFVDHYGAQNWLGGNGIPIRDWKAKVRNLGAKPDRSGPHPSRGKSTLGAPLSAGAKSMREEL